MKRDFDAAAKTWDQNDARTRVSLRIADVMVEQLKLSGTETLLDYGTGTGTVALRLQPHVAQVIAADSSQGMLDVLKDKVSAAGIPNVTPVRLDLEARAPGAELHPQVVVSAMTLHHIADTAKFAQTLYAWLPSGGQIALADLDTESGDFHPDNTGVHHFGFDRAALIQVFTQAGFKNARCVTAYEVKRPNAQGVLKTYPIFLLVAEK